MNPLATVCSPSASGGAHPAVLNQAWESGVECWASAVESAGRYWSGALARQAGPAEVTADVIRWYRHVSDRRPPDWASPNRLVFRDGILALRDFSDGATDDVVPTLVLPPQAGHHSCIVDYSREQSQMKVIRAAGLTRAYSMEWIGATQATKDARIEDYIAGIDRAVAHIGAPVNLVGDCQGGWLAAIYAALRPENVHTLTIAGAPIDFHAGEAVIHGYVQALSPGRDMSFYERLVASGGGVFKGEYLLAGFIVIKPESELDRQLQLLGHLDDEEHLARYRAFEDWFKWTQDLPGGFYLWIVERLFRDNALIAGTLEVGGERVDLRRIDCPLYLLAGEKDHITPPAQVYAARHHVSTPAEHVRQRLTSGGHLGLFMGREALAEHWPPIMADVYARSTPEGRVELARARAATAAPDPDAGEAIPAP